MSGGDHEPAREEFLVEAQELIETLSRDVLALEQAQREGTPDPDLLNALFRGVHTLKGLSGLFEQGGLGRLAHALEDLLEQLRMGRAALDDSALDLLFEGVQALSRLLAADAAEADIGTQAFAARVQSFTR